MVWKLLLSRLGLFKEMFSDISEKKNQQTQGKDTDVATTTRSYRTTHSSRWHDYRTRPGKGSHTGSGSEG